MKKIKNIWLGKVALIAAMAFTATACQQDEIIEMAKPMPQGEYISFNIQRGWDYDAISRSGDSEYGSHLSEHILVSEDKSESLEMSAYQQPIDTWFDNTRSRGTMIQAANFNEFMAFGYKTKDDVTEEIFASSYHSLANEGDDDAGWEKPVDTTEGSENANGYSWPGADYTCNFFGIAMSDNKLTNQDFYSNVSTTTNDAGQIVAFDYTVPDAAIDQPDIMVAASGDVAGDGSEGANLNFKHILSAINIKVGTAKVGEDITGITINSITFNNIYAKATYTIATNAWTNSVYFDVKESFSVDFNGAESGTGSYSYQSGSNSIMNGAAATLMLLPQTLRNDATVTVSYTLTGTGINRDVATTANIGGSIWEAGKAINYVLNINNEDGVEFITEDKYVDAHYFILPLNIRSQNPGGTVSIRARDKNNNEVSWIKFRKNLVEVENDGWWANPADVWNIDENGDGDGTDANTSYTRYSTLASNLSNQQNLATGQCYAFLEENITNVNREVCLQLLIDNVVKDEITITQLCPTWTGTKGCERVEEGEPLPWGYSWDLKEGEDNYEVVVKTSGFIETVWFNIANWLYGGAATHPGGGEWWNTDYTRFVFDYTSFLNNMANSTTGAGSPSNGLQNTTYMFNYSSAGNLLGFYEYLTENGGTVESETFEGISYTEYATKEALKKNSIKVYVGSSSGQSEHNPVIDATRTDLWYLPATGEVSILQNNADMVSAETEMKTGDLFWTSTAAATPNAYVYSFGNTIVSTGDNINPSLADRDNPYRVRAIRDITTASTTTE